MIKTINVASEKNGYTMTDRGTYIKYADTLKGDPPLVVLVEGDKVPVQSVQRDPGQPGQVQEREIRFGQEVLGLDHLGEGPEGDRGVQAVGQEAVHPQRRHVRVESHL